MWRCGRWRYVRRQGVTPGTASPPPFTFWLFRLSVHRSSVRTMTTTLNPYIQFTDNAREAMEFYKGVFGGDLTMSTFGEFGGGDPEHQAPADGIMHAQLNASGMTLMASDTPPGMPGSSGAQISISLSGDDATELKGFWDGLSEGGQVTMPLEKQMWGDEFGMLTDKFGIAWMVNIAGEQSGEQPAAE